jgi:putative ABC transport system substrate-binding protein
LQRAGTSGSNIVGQNQYDRLPSLAAELIHRDVSVIAALTTPSAIAAKAATATIPIVFTTIADPVQIGLVESLNRPGGNLTGVTFLNVEIVPKMLELLHEVVPTATTMAALVNPTNPNADIWSSGLQGAAHPHCGGVHEISVRETYINGARQRPISLGHVGSR